MNSFPTIPFVDILSFLSSHFGPTNNYDSTNKSQAYESAIRIIRTYQTKNDQIISAPISILDWIIADNLSSTGVKIDRFTTSAILSSDDDLLLELANILRLNHVDKERIVRILGYLNLLDNNISIFETLPEDILFVILQNLDCDELLLTCLISSKFNKLDQKGDIAQILKNKLRERTRLKLDHYNRKELVFLSKNNGQINVSASGNHGLYIKNGNIYGFEKGIDNLFKTSIHISARILNNIKQISTGGNHTLTLTEDGQVYSFGTNNSGKLGLGHTKNMNIPTLILGLKNIIQISAGGDHSLLLTKNGEIYSFGCGKHGQLGHGDYMDRITPTLVPNINNIIQISAGGYYSLLLTKNGEIYSFGNNIHGQLGMGDSSCKNVPTLIPIEYFDNSQIVQVSAGTCHSLALTIDGNIYSFGYGAYGRLGLGNIKSRNRPTLIPTNYFNNQHVSHVSAGRYYSLILTEIGQLYSFGDPVYQQSGIKENYSGNVPALINGVENIIDISIGSSTLLMLNKHGEIYYFIKSENSKKITGEPLLLDKIS